MNTNVSISFELILLINWILKNEKGLLNCLVKNALDKGFLQEIEKNNTQEILQEPDQLYVTILEFLVHLEKALIKNLETMDRDKLAANAVMPVLKKINFENIDLKTVWISLQQTKTKFNKNYQKKVTEKTQEEAAALLFEQLLKNWKPTKKEPLN